MGCVWGGVGGLTGLCLGRKRYKRRAHGALLYCPVALVAHYSNAHLAHVVDVVRRQVSLRFGLVLVHPHSCRRGVAGLAGTPGSIGDVC